MSNWRVQAIAQTKKDTPDAFGGILCHANTGLASVFGCGFSGRRTSSRITGGPGKTAHSQSETVFDAQLNLTRRLIAAGIHRNAKLSRTIHAGF